MSRFGAFCQSRFGGFIQSRFGARGCRNDALSIFIMVWSDESTPYLEDPSLYNEDRFNLESAVDGLRGARTDRSIVVRIGIVWPRPFVDPGAIHGPRDINGGKPFSSVVSHIQSSRRPLTLAENLSVWDELVSINRGRPKMVGFVEDTSGSMNTANADGSIQELQARLNVFGDIVRFDTRQFNESDERWIPPAIALMEEFATEL